MAKTYEKVARISGAVSVKEEEFDVGGVMQPISGESGGKHLLSMGQFGAEDIYRYIHEAAAAEALIRNPRLNGIDLLPRVVLKAVMRQPSTRTGGSMTTAMRKLGGSAELISGMNASSEAKGESLPDSWIAFATQSDIIGTRTSEEYGPALAAHSIDTAYRYGKLWRPVPVINLGDGINEHPTQALGDLFTIHERLGQLRDVKIAIVGDHERYRAFHSLILGAAAVGMRIMTVESPAAPVPDELAENVGANLVGRQMDLDSAMAEADVVYLGRQPDEYTDEDKEDKKEEARSERLAADYESWRVDLGRLQQMRRDAIVMHPRPRRDELDPSVDSDPRMEDVEQMAKMIAMRMAIIALHAGQSITAAVHEELGAYA